MQLQFKILWLCNPVFRHFYGFQVQFKQLKLRAMRSRFHKPYRFRYYILFRFKLKNSFSHNVASNESRLFWTHHWIVLFHYSIILMIKLKFWINRFPRTQKKLMGAYLIDSENYMVPKCKAKLLRMKDQPRRSTDLVLSCESGKSALV